MSAKIYKDGSWQDVSDIKKYDGSEWTELSTLQTYDSSTSAWANNWLAMYEITEYEYTSSSYGAVLVTDTTSANLGVKGRTVSNTQASMSVVGNFTNPTISFSASMKCPNTIIAKNSLLRLYLLTDGVITSQTNLFFYVSSKSQTTTFNKTITGTFDTIQFYCCVTYSNSVSVVDKICVNKITNFLINGKPVGGNLSVGSSTILSKLTYVDLIFMSVMIYKDGAWTESSSHKCGGGGVTSEINSIKVYENGAWTEKLITPYEAYPHDPYTSNEDYTIINNGYGCIINLTPYHFGVASASCLSSGGISILTLFPAGDYTVECDGSYTASMQNNGGGYTTYNYLRVAAEADMSRIVLSSTSKKTFTLEQDDWGLFIGTGVHYYTSGPVDNYVPFSCVVTINSLSINGIPVKILDIP